MNKGSTFVLRGVITLIGAAVAAACIFLLPFAIRTDTTGYYQPILVGIYVTTIPFFIALYYGFRLLSLIDHNRAFTAAAPRTLRRIQHCAYIISGLYTAGLPYIYYAADRDDAPGVLLIGIVFAFASFVVGTFAAVLGRLLQNAVSLQSDNDLTV